MPVSFARNAAATNSATLQQMMTKLQAALIAAGWTLEFANADAIGTGTAAAPAWDKAAVANTSGGVAIFSMPASGLPTRWFVRLEAHWNAVNQIFIKATTGTGQAGGVLTNPGSEITINQLGTTATNVNGELLVNAYEHGFTVAIGAVTVGWLLSVERKRTLGGVVGDDLTLTVCGAATPILITGMPGVTDADQGWCLTRSIVNGEYSPQKFVYLLGPAGTSVVVELSTYNNLDATEGFPLGPLLSGGGLGGYPRLWLVLGQGDSVAGVDQPVTIDGSNKSFSWQRRQSPASPFTTRVAWYLRDSRCQHPQSTSHF